MDSDFWTLWFNLGCRYFKANGHCVAHADLRSHPFRRADAARRSGKNSFNRQSIHLLRVATIC